MTIRTMRLFPDLFRLFGAAAAVALAIVPFDYALSANPKAAPLMCRGGGAMTGQMDVYKGSIRVIIRFAGGKQSVKKGVPGPGECRWLDRAFRKGEPQELRFRTKDYRSFTMSFKGDGMVREFKGGKPTNGTKALSALLDAVRKPEIFYVQAKAGYRLNKPRPWLDVDRLGP